MSAPDTEPGLDLRVYARAIKRRWYLVLMGGLLGVALAWGYLAVQPPQATAQALVNLNVISDDPFELVREPSGLIDAQTETQTVRSSAVVERSAKELGGGLTPARLRDGLKAEVDPDATIVRISYTADTVAGATAGADEVARQFLAYRSELASDRVDAAFSRLSERRDLLRDDLLRIDQEIARARPGSRQALQAQADRDVARAELEGVLAQMSTLGGIDTTAGSVITSASDLGAYLAPNAASVLPVGALVGLLLGLVLAFARDALDGRVRDDEDLARAGGGPVLARLPARATVPPRQEERDELRGALERLAANLPATDPVLSVVDLTGTRGAPDVAINLACALADTGADVELVVLGLRRHDLRDLERWLGLTSTCLDADGESGLTFTTPRVPGLRVQWWPNERFRAERLCPSPTSRHDQPQTGGAVTLLAVAAPAVRADRLLAARTAHATVVVVEERHGRRAALREAVADVRAVAGPVVGTLLVRGRRAVAATHESRRRPVGRPAAEAPEPQEPAGVAAGGRS